MMYGTNKNQMAASTMRAISKKKPMANAGAKPSKKEAQATRPRTPAKAVRPTKPKITESTYEASINRGVRKALRMPPAK